MHYKKNKKEGYTLMELMITVAIIGILAAIAYPSYTEYVYETRRSEAYTALMELQLEQTKLRGSCLNYATGIDSSSDCSKNKVKGLSESINGYYDIDIPKVSGNAYVLRAKAKGAQTGDSGCTELLLSVSASYPKGVKSPESCW